MGYRDNYEAWLRDFAGDEATIADLQAIAGDEKEIEDRFYKTSASAPRACAACWARG